MCYTDVNYDKCDRCGKEAELERVYFQYPHVKCECHGPNHFEIREYCKDCKAQAKEPEYSKVSFKTEDLKNPVAIAMNILKEVLKEDKSEGSYYHSWKSNLACAIMDNSIIRHGEANEIAERFLENLIRQGM